MKHANLRGLILVGMMAAGSAFAAEQLPAGVVACQSREAAQDYAKFERTAPEFAADLLARATCYQLREPAKAVLQGRVEEGFQAYKLLSGHQVWLPVQR